MKIKGHSPDKFKYSSQFYEEAKAWEIISILKGDGLTTT